MNFWSTLIILCCCFVGWFSIGVYGGDIVHEDDKAPKKPDCENNFVLVKVPTWVDGFEDNQYVGIGARFGPTLESKEKHANQTRLSLADPPDCCSPPKNKLTGEAILVYRGNCSFTTKTNIAEDAGASAILIVNNSTDLFKMVCEDDADTNIRIPAVMLPIYAGETLEDLLYNNSKVYVQLYSPKRPEVDVAEVFLWLMAVGTILCASYWAAWNAREAAIEQEKMLKDASEEMLISADSGSTGFVDISTRSALLFIVVASCFLVMLYKLMSLWFIDVLVVLFCIGGAEKEMGEKLLSAVDLLQKFKNYHDELQVEKDHALQEAKELRKQHTRELSRSYVPISDFSLSDIEKATNYFDPALKIGKGGKGSTYKGFLHHTNVAIKLLNPNNILGPREFEQEVNVLNKLRHPNIVTLMGVCSESWSLVYEYLPRGSLEDWLFCKDNTPSLTWKTRIQIATQLCSVLIFLHSSCSNSIIKGYLTPANILLDDNFVCKLLDFGTCAGIPNEGISMDQTRFIAIELKDTFMYKAPEFLVNGEFTPKSDVFSFGIILLHLLTGTQALGAKEVESALAKDDLKVILDHSAGDWPFVQAKQLAHMALRCCDMNPMNRPDLVSDIWRVLEPMKASFQPLSRLLLDSEDQVPHYFICPIFQEIMEDPHIAADGFTYEAEAIKGWLDSCHDTSPMTNEKLANHDLIPNRALRSAIQEWLQHRCSV